MPTRPGGQRTLLPGLPRLPSMLRSAQLFPSLAGEGCPPSLTLYLLSGQVALSGALVGTEAALDPQAHLGPPDLDRHTMDERRDPLVLIHPTGTEQRESGQAAHPFTQRTEG